MARNIVLGILAHVDAGKTTLTESLLLKSGAIRKAGRVDHRDSFLDTDAQERERGITIYDKNAMFSWNNVPFTLIDTPGHTDFAGEMERALSVLDAAVLVISAPNSVQSYTRTLWKLLQIYNIPVFIFVNKMDMPGVDKLSLQKELSNKLGMQCAEYSSDAFYELAAESDENALEAYIEHGTISDETVKKAINSRALFPCIYGSALYHEGTQCLLDAISCYSESKTKDGDFSAKIYKISRDARGERLVFLKVLSGELKVRTPIRNVRNAESFEEKISSIRFYSGDKYTTGDKAEAGSICAVTGLKSVIAGDTLGEETLEIKPVIEPVFTYSVILSGDSDPSQALKCFKMLEEEDPLLKAHWNDRYQEISIQVMGDVALEILARTLRDRFKLDVRFDSGNILYKETIAAPVNGCGHYEPLRHYAEVHLRLEPAPRGSGIRVKSTVSVDELALNWQRLIYTHICEKQHVGVLTGSPLTDVLITLTGGRAHLKHTEGGDFRQATYRAIRQALMQAENILLEPWYEMQIVLPQECAGRAMTDINRMGGTFEPPKLEGEMEQITARVPVRLAHDYQKEVTVYTKGRGSMSLNVYGYEKCPDQEKIVDEIGYDAERDTENPADSVFCSHGAGVLVKWSEAEAHMHIKEEKERAAGTEPTEKAIRSAGVGDEEELRAIFERTYGKRPERRIFDRAPSVRSEEMNETFIPVNTSKRPEYLLVDGYNVIFAWPDLKNAANGQLELGRKLLSDILDNYAPLTEAHIILVFDAYKVKNNPGRTEKYGNIDIVYTKEAQTADSYIEKLAYELTKLNRVRVATSDGLEQLIILGSGALRMTALELKNEIASSNFQMNAILQKLNLNRAGTNLGNVLSRAMKDGKEQ